MQKRLLISVIIAMCVSNIDAQDDSYYYQEKHFSSAILLGQHNMAKWNIPAGNYSGITHIEGSRYAVVTDKPKSNGFYEFDIKFSEKGDIISMKNLGFRTDSTININNYTNTKANDLEGIVFCPQTNTLFISDESNQQIVEYYKNGNPTNRKIETPECFNVSKISNNYGFESLAYSPETHLFWTTTENSLPSDAPISNPSNAKPAILRLQSFTEDLKPYRQYAYKTDTPKAKSSTYKFYCFGVPEITALSDGSLLILERELRVSKSFLNSFVENKIYLINPVTAACVDQNERIDNLPDFIYLPKTLVTKFRTKITNFANYEGMCLGPILSDGTQTLILISDSQDNYGNSIYHLKDYIRVILLK